VTLYVDKDLNYKVVEKMSMVVDNLLECVTIEDRLDRRDIHKNQPKGYVHLWGLQYRLVKPT